jgi:hypothetical protein
MFIGAIALPIVSVALALVVSESTETFSLPPGLTVVGWTVALAVPLAVAAILRNRDAWPMGVATAWTVALLQLRQSLGPVSLYAWWGLGAIGLVGWAVADRRSERVNMGAAIFAATVLAFYFSQVMDKLERSASLVGLGVLFLAGGWSLERIRRRLVRQARGETA